MPLLKSYFILINYQNNQKNSRGVQGHTPKDGTGTYPRDHMLTGLGVFSLVLRLKKKKAKGNQGSVGETVASHFQQVLGSNVHLWAPDSPLRMLQDRDHQLHSQGTCNHGQAWAAHCALLVQSPVSG